MKLKKNKLKKLFLNFIFYCVIGWIYEVFLEVIVYKWGFSNRGILFGPYLPIYGIGSMIFLLLLGRLKEKKIYFLNINITPLLIFLGIVFITTTLELLGSYIMEFLSGSWAWDYRNYFLNFQGRIALNPSIRFGLGGMVIMYIFQPMFEKFIKKINVKYFNYIFNTVFILFSVDLIVYIKNIFMGK